MAGKFKCKCFDPSTIHHYTRIQLSPTTIGRSPTILYTEHKVTLHGLNFVFVSKSLHFTEFDFDGELCRQKWLASSYYKKDKLAMEELPGQGEKNMAINKLKRIKL